VARFDEKTANEYQGAMREIARVAENAMRVVTTDINPGAFYQHVLFLEQHLSVLKNHLEANFIGRNHVSPAAE
jgi:hypothetical protein